MVAGLLAGRFLLLLLQRLLLIRSSRQRLGIVLGRIHRLLDGLGFLRPTGDIAGLLDLRHFLLPRRTLRLLLLFLGRERLGLPFGFGGCSLALGCLRLGRPAAFLPCLLGSAQLLLLFRALRLLGRSLFLRRHRRRFGLGGIPLSLQLRLV